MMYCKATILFLVILANALMVSAQMSPDSAVTIRLDEVQVNASLRTQRGDTLSIIPSENQRKFSMTGYEVLRGMMLPGLRVNPVTGSLSLSDGGRVIVLIDERPVERQEILAVRPKEIARVEYLQTPGTEYGFDSSIGAVINIVMRKRKDGYVAAILTNNAVTTANGENFAFGKYTNNNSEYNLSINSGYTSLTKRRIDGVNSYMTGDSPHKITFQGINTPLKYTQNSFQAGYNYFRPKHEIFDVTIKGVFYYSPERAHAQKVTEEGLTPYFQLTEPYERYFSPQLKLYYKRFLTDKSSLSANFVGTFRHSNYIYDITQSETEEFDDAIYSYGYGTKSNRQSYIGEVKYMNRINRLFNFNVGSRVRYAYTSSSYEADNSSADKQHDTNIYTYASSYGYIGNLYYMLGMGLSGRLISQNSQHRTKWIFRPQLQVAYSLKGWKFNLYGTLDQKSPSLSEMASAEFRINQYEIKEGNPDITDWWQYRVSLRINKNVGPVNFQNTINYNQSIDPIMMSVSRRQTPNGYIFVSSYENQRRMSVFSESLNIDWGISSNFNISVGAIFKSYQSRGLTYSRNLNNWHVNIAGDWTSGNWNIGLNWSTRERSLFGETISYTGATNTVYVNYIVGNRWRFGLVGQHLFSKSGPTFRESLKSHYMSKEESVIVPAQKNMIMVTAAWNFSVGKQRKEARIDISNDDNTSNIFK